MGIIIVSVRLSPTIIGDHGKVRSKRQEQSWEKREAFRGNSILKSREHQRKSRVEFRAGTDGINVP